VLQIEFLAMFRPRRSPPPGRFAGASSIVPTRCVQRSLRNRSRRPAAKGALRLPVNLSWNPRLKWCVGWTVALPAAR
jgi:hypothetical protein